MKHLSFLSCLAVTIVASLAIVAGPATASPAFKWEIANALPSAPVAIGQTLTAAPDLGNATVFDAMQLTSLGADTEFTSAAANDNVPVNLALTAAAGRHASNAWPDDALLSS